MRSAQLTRRHLLRSAAAPLVLAAPRRTNVVLLMTDDQAPWSLGCYGCADIHTPHIDRLAAEGARFTNHFACTPVCSPSRMTWLTGLLPSAHGVQDYLRAPDSYGPRARRFLAGRATCSEILARAGWTLGVCGKWHMGDDERPHAGFSWWRTIPRSAYRDPVFCHDGQTVESQGFATDLTADRAIEFLDAHRDRPFFLLVAFNAPHTPYGFQPDDDRRPYEASPLSCFPDLPPHPAQNPELRAHHGNRASRQSYAALVSGVDRNVGRIVARLGELGLRESTAVIFTSDQGWNAGHHGVWGKGNGTIPFNLYEESIRSPLIWSHPGAIRGQTLSPLLSAYDFFPTILDYLGARAPADPRRPGRSYAAWLRGRPPRSWRDRVYFEYAYMRGVRTTTWKLVERAENWPGELYDLAADPGETRNVAAGAAYRPRWQSLRQDLAAFFARQGAPPLEQWRTTSVQEGLP